MPAIATASDAAARRLRDGMKQKSRKQRQLDVVQSQPTDQDQAAPLAAPAQQSQPSQDSSYPSDPLLLVALHASRPQLSLDDILACRCVCKAWKQRLGTAFCHTIRIPHSLWHEAASSDQLAQAVAAAAAAYPHATTVLLDAGGSRPGLPATIWQPLQQALNPWLTSSSSDSSISNSGTGAADSTPRAAPAASSPAGKQLHLRLQAPPSPCRLQALQAGLPQLSALQIQHTSQSLYSRHLAALATLIQLQSLVLTLSHPRMDLRSLTHQRTRRVPLSMDCLSSLTRLTQLELSSKGPTDELLPDTIAAFSKPASLAELSRLQSLALSEAALRGPLPAAAWVAQLPGLTKLQLVLLDEPGKGALARGHTSSSSSRGGATTSGSAAVAAASGGGSAQTAAAPAGEQQHRSSTPKLPQQPSAAAASGAAASSGGSSSSGANAQHQQRSAGSSSSGGAAGGTAPAVVPPLDLAAALPGLACLHVANVGDRLVSMRIPAGLTSLAIHLSSPCPAGVTGEQLAAVVMQASPGLRQLELGLGMRFSLTGTAMRGLKRGLKQLQQLTLIEGAQDHLEGLGCWCNLASLTLVEGRCSVPLRGLYELSMRAAMGRTPGMLRYCGHVRHADELASRLGPALHQLRLDSLVGLAGGNSITGGGGASSGGGVVAGAAAAAAAARSVLSSSGSGSCGQFSYADAEAAEAAAAAAEVAMLQAQLLSDDAAPLAAAAAAAAAAPAAGGLVPALQQLSALTRLEVAGERLGQLDFAAAAVLSGLSRLVVLEVVGGEPWLQPALGVKEQLVWLSGLRGLRRLRLGGVMLGRSRLAGETSRSGSTAGATAAGGSGKGTAGGGSKAGSGSGMLAHGGMPTVKGLGNGLAYAGGSCSAGRHAAAAAGTTGAGAVPDPAAAAAARDVAAALCLEELRRWLADLLPHARVWLD